MAEEKTHGHKLAGNLKRLAAFIIDAIIWVAFAIFIVVVQMLAAVFLGQLAIIVFAACGLFAIAAALAYFIGFEASHFQATPGKMAMGLIVTDKDGRRITISKSVIRYFGKCVSGAILYLGFAPILFTKDKQGLHDMLAGTVVIERPSAPAKAAEKAKEGK